MLPCYILRAKNKKMMITHNVLFTDSILEIDGVPMSLDCPRQERLNYLYDNYLNDYPKFFRMDALSKLGYIASELLVKKDKEGKDNTSLAYDSERIMHGTSVILFCNTGSLVSDCQYEMDMNQKKPCAGDFVYTLPNIVAGEIAIRNGFKGPTAMYLINRKDSKLIETIVQASMLAEDTSRILYGWIDLESNVRYEADFFIYEL